MRLKKIFSILLVFCIGLSIVGFYPVFVTLQYETRQEIKMRIKQGIPENEIHKIVFAVNEKINWVREGKEFRLNNQMFDIVRHEQVNGQVIYYCINDKEEEQLFANLDELVKKQMEDESSAKGNTAKLLFKIFSQTYIPVETFLFTNINVSSKLSFQYDCELTSVNIETETQPPDLG